MNLGLDFGTTNSSAALFRDGRLTIVKSSAAESSGILPSLIYVTRNHQHILGREAARRYLQDDTGRPAIWETKHAGIIDYWVSLDMPSVLGGRVEPVLVQQDIYVQEDIGAKGRLLQSVKTALRNPNYVGTAIFGQKYTIEQLITLLLDELRAAAEETTGKPANSVLLGRPVTFTHDTKGDAQAEAILRSAAQSAGFPKVQFMLEPIAAAYSYHISLKRRHTVLVFDFGGGTLDLTVIRIGDNQPPDVLATHGLLLGGDDFDKRIMERFLWKHFGYGKPFEGDRKISYEVYDYLLDWARHPDLTRHDYYRDIKRAATVSKAGPEFTALYSLINNKFGYQLFERIEQTKIALSTQEEATLSFHADGIALDQPITRQAFNRAIRDYCAQIDRAVAQVVVKAGLKTSDINVVLSTGGSSSVPAVLDILENRFGPGRIMQHDPFLSVSSGLAIAAAAMNGTG